MEMNEHFEDLKELIDDSFFDKYLKCRVRIREETQEEEVEQYVTLQSIHTLKLSEEEEVFLINYLGSLGISVSGVYSCYSGICDNYTQSNCFERANAHILNEEDQLRYLEEYQRTKDIEIRNKVVESNLPLVKYLSRKYSYLYEVEQEFLESYGVEGLITAMDTYDFTRGKLSAHLSIKIRNSIFSSIIIFHLGEYGSTLLNTIAKNKSENTKYFEYFYVTKEIENKRKSSLKDNPELIEEIACELVNRGYCEGKNLEELKARASVNKPYSYEQIKENLRWVDDDTLYKETLESIYQEELGTFVQKMTKDLTENRKKILDQYYGFGDEEECRSFKKIGKKTYRSRQAIFSSYQEALECIEKKARKVPNITKSFVEHSNHEYEGDSQPIYIKRK